MTGMKEGTPFAVRDGRLVRIAPHAIADHFKLHGAAWIKELAGRIGITCPEEITDIRSTCSEDLLRITLEIDGNGLTASQTFDLPNGMVN